MVRRDEVDTVFDADNHYWESTDAFTRYRSPEFADRGVVVREVDGKLRYVIRGELHPWIPGPGDANPRPKPGALHDFYPGMEGASINAALMAEDPKVHPEWFNRDARLGVMDEQGVEAVWMFPSQGVCMEGPMQPDVPAILDILRAFNRWIDDEWGFAYKDRIFSAAYLTLSDLDYAVDELEWAIDRGVRLIAVRPGPVFTDSGWHSPADPAFDRFWARVAEAKLIVANHPGFDDGYRDVENAVARSWGYGSRRKDGQMSSLNFYEPFVSAVMGQRLIHDFYCAIVYHGLFDRHPDLRFASIENGALWVPEVQTTLRTLSRSKGKDMVEVFREHVWVTPFTQDRVDRLLEYMPEERLLFGSDWPHAEGFAEPKRYVERLEGLPIDIQRKIMRDNARQLTFA